MNREVAAPSAGPSAGPITGRAGSRRSWDTVSEPARGQAGWVAAGVAALPLGLVATGLRLVPPEADGPALLASFVPFAALGGYGTALMCFGAAVVRARRRRLLGLLTAGCLALFGLHLAWLAPLFLANNRPAAARPFTVMQLNILGGAADVGQIVARSAAADLVVLVEANPVAVERLSAAGLTERLPYVVAETAEGPSNAAIYSRYPLSAVSAQPPTRFPQLAATTTVPGIGAVRLLTVHPCNPFCGGGAWAREHQILRAAIQVNSASPLVVVGDFNAVADHAPMQALHRDGLRSAADLAGAGYQPTYPANSRVPALLPIDSLLVNDRLTAEAVQRFHVDGTDHLGLVTTLTPVAR